MECRQSNTNNTRFAVRLLRRARQNRVGALDMDVCWCSSGLNPSVLGGGAYIVALLPVFIFEFFFLSLSSISCMLFNPRTWKIVR